jgi:hypothetical protein
MTKTHAQQAAEWLQHAERAHGQDGVTYALANAQVHATLAVAAELNLIRNRMEPGEQ